MTGNRSVRAAGKRAGIRHRDTFSGNKPQPQFFMNKFGCQRTNETLAWTLGLGHVHNHDARACRSHHSYWKPSEASNLLEICSTVWRRRHSVQHFRKILVALVHVYVPKSNRQPQKLLENLLEICWTAKRHAKVVSAGKLLTLGQQTSSRFDACSFRHPPRRGTPGLFTRPNQTRR